MATDQSFPGPVQVAAYRLKLLDASQQFTLDAGKHFLDLPTGGIPGCVPVPDLGKPGQGINRDLRAGERGDGEEAFLVFLAVLACAAFRTGRLDQPALLVQSEGGNGDADTLRNFADLHGLDLDNPRIDAKGLCNSRH